MLRRSTIQLLRFHFSLFLLPVYLFAVSQAGVIHWRNAVLSFIVLHGLVYPASNGYNSYMDRDETPIGGLASPPQPTKQLFYVTAAMDMLAVLLSYFVSHLFAVGVLLYILASRAYSYRGIRLKKYPFIGFFTVFVFQGAVVYCITFSAVNAYAASPPSPLAGLLSSLLIGALYPLTQIYQHDEDKKDGVTTISYKLGKRGTFVFSAALFLSATAGMYFLFAGQNRLNHFVLFLLYLLPAVSFFLYWTGRVWRDAAAANFINSLRMNVLSTLCTAAYFITLLILNH